VLSEFGRRHLDAFLATTVTHHLAECPDCRGRLSGLSGVETADHPAESQSSGPAPPAVGAQLDLSGHPEYEFIRELDRGGMGVVYLIRNKLMDRLEVLKLLHRPLGEKPGSAERFLREIRAAAKLSHPNVVTAYRVIPLGDQLAYTMEYVEGEDLAKFVKARGPLDVPRACHFVAQAALGLQHAHEHGMVHRDIKPGNLIRSRVSGKQVVKVLDFGLAKAPDVGIDASLTGANDLLGTPDFVAPEQIQRAKTVDIRADIYSLGCTLYYLLTARPPFAEGTTMQRLTARLTDPPDPLTRFRSDVPAALVSVLGTMLARDPADRYATPAAVAVALAPFAEDNQNSLIETRLPVAPTEEKTPPMSESAAPAAGRRPPRRPVTALWVALAALLLTIVVAIPLAIRQFGGSATEKPIVVDLGGGVTMEFMRVHGTAAGTFWMGSPLTEPERNPWEQRFDAEEQTAVTIPADFLMGRAEVTQEQWVEVMGFAANRSQNMGNVLPVENISWDDTQLFLQKLNEKMRPTRQTFRLPTEAEWEYACRGGATGKDDSKPFHFHDGPNSQITSDRANFDAKSAAYNGSVRGQFREETTPAGRFPPNRFGLFDMHGNVWEWCQDYYGPLPGGRNPLRDAPYRGDERRVLRGGSWHVDGADCRAAVRYGAAPTERAHFTGFRVVLELP